MRASNILILIVLCTFGVADLACVTNVPVLEFDSGLYPIETESVYGGGEPCFIGHMCSWFYKQTFLNSSIDLAISVNFNPPLFYFLSTNKYRYVNSAIYALNSRNGIILLLFSSAWKLPLMRISISIYTITNRSINSMKGDDRLSIDIPPPTEDKIGRYTLDLVVTAKNFSFHGCTDFEIRRAPTYSVTKYIPTDNSTIFNAWDLLGTAVNSVNYPNYCDQPFNFSAFNDFSQYDPIKAIIASNQLNAADMTCLHNMASRFYSAVMNGAPFLIADGNRQELFWTDGMQIYQRVYNSSYNIAPLIDTWLPAFENYQQGGSATEGKGLYAHTRYVDALINRMARTGVLDTRLPRAIHFLMSTMLNFMEWAPATSWYFNGIVEAGYAMRTMVTWGMLTNDDRVPYVLKTFSDFAKTWITDDYEVLLNFNNKTFHTLEMSNAMAMGFAAYWRYNGDQQNYDLAVKLLNVSVTLGPNYLYTGKHTLYFINRNFDTIKWFLDPSVPLVDSKIPFVFPDIVIPTNTTVVLPGQKIEITTTTTLNNNLELTSESTISTNYGEQLNVKGCATLAGTQEVVVKEGQEITNGSTVMTYACHNGEFDQFVISGDTDPCKEYQLSYTPTSVTIIITRDDLCVIPPTSDRLPDWAIAVIVVGSVGVCGAIIGIVLHFKKIEHEKMMQRLEMKTPPA